MSVSVCPSAQTPHVQTSRNFPYDPWPWLGPLLTTMQHVNVLSVCGCLRLPADLSPLAATDRTRPPRAMWKHCTLVASTVSAADECIRRCEGVTGTKSAIADCCHCTRQTHNDERSSVTWSPLNVHDPNFMWQLCSSNGKYLTSMVQELL